MVRLLSYLGDAQNAGAALALHSPVLSGAVTPDGIESPGLTASMAVGNHVSRLADYARQ